MKPVVGQSWSGGYGFHPFDIKTTSLDFEYSRRNVGTGRTGEIKGCNIAAAWNPYLQEALINGVQQGRKQTDVRGASALSRSRMFILLKEVHLGMRPQDGVSSLIFSDYRELKRSKALQDRQGVKKAAKEEALKGWGESFDHAITTGEL